MTKAGTVHAGGVMESAAYNPTLPPLQAALIAAAADGVASWCELSCQAADHDAVLLLARLTLTHHSPAFARGEISEAVLVEMKDAQVSQAGIVRSRHSLMTALWKCVSTACDSAADLCHLCPPISLHADEARA